MFSNSYINGFLSGYMCKVSEDITSPKFEFNAAQDALMEKNRAAAEQFENRFDQNKPVTQGDLLAVLDYLNTQRDKDLDTFYSLFLADKFNQALEKQHSRKRLALASLGLLGGVAGAGIGYKISSPENRVRNSVIGGIAGMTVLPTTAFLLDYLASRSSV